MRGPTEGAEAGLQALIAHALLSSGSRPTATWQHAGRALFAELGPEQARAAITSWLAPAGEPRTVPVYSVHSMGNTDLELDPFNTLALRGLAGLPALAPAHPESTAVLGRLVQQALVRLPGIGPRSPKRVRLVSRDVNSQGVTANLWRGAQSRRRSPLSSVAPSDA